MSDATVSHTGLLRDNGMSSLSAEKLLASLARLSKQAGENYYKRIVIADTLLKDKAWTDKIGDEYKAAEFLQDKYFHDLSGSNDDLDALADLPENPRRDCLGEGQLQPCGTV